MSITKYPETLEKVFSEKLTDYQLFMNSHSRYCGGEMDFDGYAHVRYNADAPSNFGISLEDERHRMIEDWQLRMNKCFNCNSQNLYLSKFEVGEYGMLNYQYVKNEYYCPECSLQYQVEGEWK